MQKYSVIGCPIGHTMSPFIHEKLFTLSGLFAQYSVKEISPENLGHEMPSLCELDGFNITIPHKVAVMQYLNALDDSAALCGAVNTVKCEGGRTCGYNTDMFGFEKAASGLAPGGTSIIAGCGGAARAIAVSCLKAGGEVIFAVREGSLEKGVALSINLAGVGGTITVCADSAPPKECDLLINTTPVGMFPNVGEIPLSQEWVMGAKAVFDAVYNPGDTALLKLAQSLGKPFAGGMEMLVWQAAKAHEIWYGAQFEEGDIKKITEDAKGRLCK